MLVPALTTAALLEQERHDFAAATPLLEEYEEATRGQPYHRAQGLPDALRICIAAGWTDLGERLVEGIAETAGRPAHALVTARAVLAEARGNLEDAAQLYAQSAEGWRDFGFALEEGQALLGAGRCSLQLGWTREAAAQLQEAREKFATLWARPLVAAAEALIEQAAALAS